MGGGGVPLGGEGAMDLFLLPLGWHTMPLIMTPLIMVSFLTSRVLEVSSSLEDEEESFRDEAFTQRLEKKQNKRKTMIVRELRKKNVNRRKARNLVRKERERPREQRRTE